MNTLNDTPKSSRIHIGFFGRCNAGKSTLINMLTNQSVSLVSEFAGTTTDPVSKAMEILPLGPVQITDTAGIDDQSPLGPLRIQKTKELISKVDIAVYVLRSDRAPSEDDITWINLLKRKVNSLILIINEVRIADAVSYSGLEYINIHFELKSLVNCIDWADFTKNDKRLALLDLLGKTHFLDDDSPTGLLSGVISQGDAIVLVCPIDSAAPKGRLILPQVQMIREALDYKGICHVVQTEEIPNLLHSLKKPPALVITDSQAFEEVDKLVPNFIPLTSFSILMARFKGDLKALVEGVKALEHLTTGSRVLISEGCTHRRQCDDIGTVKIPRWLAAQGYTDLQLEWTSGGAFPDDVSQYDLIIHCGACMLSRKELLNRIQAAFIQGTPIVNYGVLIAALHGILKRAISPFISELH